MYAFEGGVQMWGITAVSNSELVVAVSDPTEVCYMLCMLAVNSAGLTLAWAGQGEGYSSRCSRVHDNEWVMVNSWRNVRLW
jgi:hypothetical protein